MDVGLGKPLPEDPADIDLAARYDAKSGVNPWVENYSSLILDDDQLLQCFLNYPDVDVQHPFMVNFQTIAAGQAADPHLQAMLQEQPTRYARHIMADNTQLIVYVRQGQPWRICIPEAQLNDLVAWYHEVLNHLGITRLCETIEQHFYHRDLRLHVEQYVNLCTICQSSKTQYKKYGEMPPRQAGLSPWHEVALDCIGPWTLSINDQKIAFTALTVIDTVTNYCEAIRLYNRTAAHCGLQFQNCWLSRYPRPIRAVHDPGPEFTGEGFQQVLRRHGINDRSTTTKNPQSNAICERMHHSVAQSL
jgi:hypothetical protein